MTDSSSLAEQAHTLLAACGSSTLATNLQKHSGYPFASVTPYALDKTGRPVFFLSALATHSRNLRNDPRATLLVAEQSDKSPVDAARVSVVGDVELVPRDEREAALREYVGQHPSAAAWAGFGDFALLRMQIVDIYFIAGFGSMGWVKPDDYFGAATRPQ